MWDYQWIEVAVGDATALEQVGRDGWEAVSMTSTGVNFGKPYVGILLKREKVRSIDLVADERLSATLVDRQVAALASAAVNVDAAAAADEIEAHWSDHAVPVVLPPARRGSA